MPETLLDSAQVWEPDLSQIITEDDTPVDNLFSEKQQRLLVEPLYSSWHPEQPFLAAANVGIFNSPYLPPIVPDMFLSLEVQAANDLWKKENRSYFIWNFGKPPEVVVEIVSNQKGRETDQKFRKYAQMRIWYYVIFDPQHLLQPESVQVYQLSLKRYVPKAQFLLDQVGLGVTLWDGEFEGIRAQWLRWCDPDGQLILTAEEGRAEAQRIAAQEREHTVQERRRAEQERQRADRLAAQLLALGINPSAIEETV